MAHTVSLFYLVPNFTEWKLSARHNSSPCIYHSEWLIAWLNFNFVGRAPQRASCSAAHLPSLAAPPYHPNTPTCLWKTVIEWVYVVRLINHINLYLLVGWLKAMTIRLMKLVNSSYPHHDTTNYNKPGGEKKHRKGDCYDRIGNQDEAANWMSAFINDEAYKKTLRKEY